MGRSIKAGRDVSDSTPAGEYWALSSRRNIIIGIVVADQADMRIASLSLMPPSLPSRNSRKVKVDVP